MENMETQNYSQMLIVAREAAAAAQGIMMSYYQSGIEVVRKADNSPVTQADIECEEAIRNILSTAYPDHGFYGEELGAEQPDAEYLWLIDPIDGTKSFVRGYPFFSAQIALMHRGELVVGVSCAPAFGQGEIAWAAKGEGAWLNEEPLQVSETDTLKETALSTGNIATLASGSGWSKLGELIPQVHRIRGYGDFYHYHLLASGRIDAVIESDVNILDIAALAVIIREAGGDFTNLQGGDLDLETTSVLATNGKLRGLIEQAGFGQ